MGLSASPSTVQPANPASQAVMRWQTSACRSGSRTTPPLPTLPLPTSNCGLISEIRRAFGAASASGGRQHGFQADEAGVANHQIDGIGHLLAGQVTGVGLFEQHHPLVLAQFPGKLPVPDIDGINLGRTAVQQHVGEAAGRGTDIQANPPRRINGEMIQRMGQFDTAARHPGMIPSTDLEWQVWRHRRSRFVETPRFGIDQTRHDKRLRPRPAFGQPAFDEQLIDAFLGDHGCAIWAKPQSGASPGK